ncbi:hemolysin family protein [Cellulomonas sp. ATA003]|uniref:hemolysin family protein n=1 Tax=Cellulomonas sp. ATA003 TaxID=3073064 RepID=UPI0028735A09|nr:hemolysin family protein [Cellulomonas sp. ATA003]WNB85382.1 hemolysin family protein [Cellulomonas sp. ATA003]
MADATALLVAVLLLAGNAFFVGAEFALISARRTQIEPRAAEGSGAARLTLRAMERVSLMMAGAQLGITMCSLGLGAIAEPAVAHLLEIPLAAIGISGPLLHTVAFTIALAIVVFLHMVLGEMVPKNIAIAGPERSAILLGPVLYGIVLVLKPLIVALNWVANVVLRLLRVDPKDEVASAFTADEVAAFVAESRQEGLLDDDAHTLLTSALSISTEPVSAVVVPLADLVVLPADVTSAQAEATCIRTGFSRFPVTGADGTLQGYLHVKDLLMAPAGTQDQPVPRSTSGRSPGSARTRRWTSPSRRCRHAGRTWPSCTTRTPSWAPPCWRTSSSGSSARWSTPVSSRHPAPARSPDGHRDRARDAHGASRASVRVPWSPADAATGDPVAASPGL